MVGPKRAWACVVATVALCFALSICVEAQFSSHQALYRDDLFSFLTYHLEGGVDSSTAEAQAVDQFVEIQKKRCLQPSSHFTLIPPFEREPRASEQLGCQECAFVLLRAEQGLDEELPGLAGGCKELLQLPCCAGVTVSEELFRVQELNSALKQEDQAQRPVAAATEPEPQPRAQAALLEELAGADEAEGDQVSNTGVAPWLQKRLDYTDRVLAEDKFRPSKDYPHYGHAHCPQDGFKGKGANVVGIADLHMHMMSGLSFGGANTWGPHNGTMADLKPCDGKWTHGLTTGQEHHHRKRKDGFPTFIGWPRWDAVSHQQIHQEWLKKAATTPGPERLRTMHMLPAHNRLLCLVAKAVRRIRHEFVQEWEAAGYRVEDVCADVPNLERQIRATHELAEKNKDWMGVALSAQECRDLMSKDKLCMVVGNGEAGDICKPEETPEQCVDRYHGMGARVFQIVHLRNNRLTGAAIHTPLVMKAHEAIEAFVQKMDKTRKSGVLAKIGSFAKAVLSSVRTALKSYPWNEVPNPNLKGEVIKYNPQGLTEDGKRAVIHAFKKGMPLDVSHVSKTAVLEIAELSKAAHHHPIYYSHTATMSFADAPEEPLDAHWHAYYTDMEEYQAVARTGGMIGLRLAAKHIVPYTKASIADTCTGSATTFAQQYEFVVRELGLPTAYAADMNGAADNSIPRFYNKNRDPNSIFELEACGVRSKKCWGGKPGVVDFLTGGSAVNSVKRWVTKGLTKRKFCKQQSRATREMQQVQTSVAKFSKKTGYERYDSQGVGSVDTLPAITKDLKQLGAVMDCPLCLHNAAENSVRMWERAEMAPEQRKPMKAAILDSKLSKLALQTIKSGVAEKDLTSAPATFESDHLARRLGSRAGCASQQNTDTAQDKVNSLLA